MDKYNPQNDLMTGIRGMEPLEMFPWDDYYPRMAQTDFLCGNADTPAVKTAFIRTAPFGGSYTIFGGLTAFLRQLHEYRFDEDVCAGLKDMGYKKEWIEFVKRRERIRVKVYANLEGSIFLGNEPMVSLAGSIHDLRIAEGMLLKNINFPSLLMTKWDRIVRAAFPNQVIEFARRRAQHDLRASLYSYLAGALGTSNGEIRRWFKIPIFGTMGHEWVQTFGEDFLAFDAWLTHNPDRATLLLDTINTLESGVPAAIKAFKKHWLEILSVGGRPFGRNDSGDLAYLSSAEAKSYGEVGLGETGVLNTNDLDEYLIIAIKEQVKQHCAEFGVPPDHTMQRLLWAVGTKGGTCYDQPALGGVMKLQEVDGVARIKISDQPVKTSIPGFNRSFFVWRGDELVCCLVCPARDYHVKGNQLFKNGIVLEKVEAIHPDNGEKRIILDEDCQFERRQWLVYDGEDFVDVSSRSTLGNVRDRVAREVGRLHWSHKRLEKPHTIKLSLTPELFELRQKMISQRVLRADWLK
ncbi:MAG: hypothetical protein AAB577_01065 [Patescibacteria group bacterium]